MLERHLSLAIRIPLIMTALGLMVGGLLIGATELRLATRGSPIVPTMLAAVIAFGIALGGALLLRWSVRAGKPRVDT